MIGSHSLGIIASQRGGGVAMTYAESVIADGAVAYWRLDETSGTVAADSSGNGRDGTYVGSVTLGVTPLITSGTAIEVPGSGSNMNSPYDGPVGTAARSYELWMATTGQAPFFSAGDASSSGARVRFQINDGALVPNAGAFAVDPSGSIIAGTTDLRDGLPHYLVATFPAGGTTSSFKLYVDGVEEATNSFAGGQVINTASGAGINVRHSLGATFDEVAIYDYVLTPQQIADRYALGTA